MNRYEEREAIEVSKKLDALDIKQEKSVEAGEEKKIPPPEEEIKPSAEQGTLKKTVDTHRI